MCKKRKICLIVAGALCVAGMLIFAAAMTALGWNFKRLDTVEYERNSHEITDAFHDICIESDTADIVFLPAEDGVCRVECYEMTKAKHAVTVKDGALTVTIADERAWYDYIGFSFDSPKITVYLPESAYGTLSIDGRTGDIEIPNDFLFTNIDIEVSTGDVTCYASAIGDICIKASTGDICTEGISANSLQLSASTGDITVRALTCAQEVIIKVSTGDVCVRALRCEKLFTQGSTGDLELADVIATQTIFAERSTGDVTLDACDAADIFITIDTGDVSGTLLTGKMFFVSTDTGDIDIPSSVSGGRCEISTDTGDITLRIE